jgi:glycosyltransferase involved in cell wall biosynthesis
VVGQLAHYVNKLAVELVKRQIDVYVVTYHDSWVGIHQGFDGVKAYRVKNPVRDHVNVISWILTLTEEFERAIADIYYSVKHEVDLIDAHEWHSIPAAVALKRAFDIPFVYSIDSIENHRSHGANAPLNLSIKSIESIGIKEAQRVIVKSDWMKSEIIKAYTPPEEKIDVVNPQSESWIEQILQSYKMAFWCSLKSNKGESF